MPLSATVGVSAFECDPVRPLGAEGDGAHAGFAESGLRVLDMERRLGVEVDVEVFHYLISMKRERNSFRESPSC